MAGSKSFVSGTGAVNVDLLFEGLTRLPGEGEEIFSKALSLRLGGGVPATLVNLAGLGVPVRLQTALGEDMFSDFARREFQKSGVPFTELHTDWELPLNVTAALLTPGERTFVSCSGAGSVTEAMRQQIYDCSKGASIVSMSPGYLDVYQQLKREGAILVLDMGWEDDLSLEKWKDYFRLADFYLPNRKEAWKLTGKSEPEEAVRVLADWFDISVVKADGDGCYYCECGEVHHIPGIREFPFRDSTGAGDAFYAGFLYGLYHGASIAQCIRYGNITGAKCVSAVGCLTERCTESSLQDLVVKCYGKTE